MIDVRIQGADFDPGRQLLRLEALAAGHVASVIIAAAAAADVSGIFVDHYPMLARNQLARTAAEAETRFGLAGIILIHRHGQLEPGERLAFAAVAAPDTRAALGACTYLADALAEAPFWRRDSLADGRTIWR